MQRLIFLGVALLLLNRGSASGKILEDHLRLGYDLIPDARVTIRNTDGRICVYGSDSPRLEIFAMRRAFSKERLVGIKISVQIGGDTAVIDTIYPPAPEGSLFADRSGTVDYVILVPQTCTLEKVVLEKGEILIEGMRGGGVTASLGRGVLHAVNCFSEIRLSLGAGGMNLRYDWWEEGAFSLAAAVAEGDLRLAVPQSASLRLDAQSREGLIHNSLVSVLPEPGGHILEADYGAGGPIFQLRAESANIWLGTAD